MRLTDYSPHKPPSRIHLSLTGFELPDTIHKAVNAELVSINSTLSSSKPQSKWGVTGSCITEYIKPINFSADPVEGVAENRKSLISFHSYITNRDFRVGARGETSPYTCSSVY